MNKHGVSRKWFTEVDVKDFKSGALRTTTEISVSPPRNEIYFSFIPLLFHYTYISILLFSPYRTLCKTHKKK